MADKIAVSLEDLQAALEERYEQEAHELMRVRAELAQARDMATASAAKAATQQGDGQALTAARHRLQTANATIRQQQTAIEDLASIGAVRALRSALLMARGTRHETGLVWAFQSWRHFGTQVTVAALETQATQLRRQMRDGVSDAQWQELFQQSRQLLADVRGERAAGAAAVATLAAEVARLESEEAAAAEEARRPLPMEPPPPLSTLTEAATSPSRPPHLLQMGVQSPPRAAPPSPPRAASEALGEQHLPPQPISQPAWSSEPSRSAAEAWRAARHELLHRSGHHLAIRGPSEGPLGGHRSGRPQRMGAATGGPAGDAEHHWAQRRGGATAHSTAAAPALPVRASWLSDGRLAGQLGVARGCAQSRAGIVPRTLTSPAMSSASILLCAGALHQRS